jgi:hypothetical protein
VSVKYIKKALIPKDGWILVPPRERGVFPSHCELPPFMKVYVSNMNPNLPHYLEHFEDDDYYYVVTCNRNTMLG